MSYSSLGDGRLKSELSHVEGDNILSLLLPDFLANAVQQSGTIYSSLDNIYNQWRTYVMVLLAQPGELTEIERFMFDTMGYLVIPNALSPDA
jgi:hypothetical protein